MRANVAMKDQASNMSTLVKAEQRNGGGGMRDEGRKMVIPFPGEVV